MRPSSRSRFLATGEILVLHAESARAADPHGVRGRHDPARRRRARTLRGRDPGAGAARALPRVHAARHETPGPARSLGGRDLPRLARPLAAIVFIAGTKGEDARPRPPRAPHLLPAPTGLHGAQALLVPALGGAPGRRARVRLRGALPV